MQELKNITFQRINFQIQLYKDPRYNSEVKPESIRAQQFFLNQNITEMAFHKLQYGTLDFLTDRKDLTDVIILYLTYQNLTVSLLRRIIQQIYSPSSQELFQDIDAIRIFAFIESCPIPYLKNNYPKFFDFVIQPQNFNFSLTELLRLSLLKSNLNQVFDMTQDQINNPFDISRQRTQANMLQFNPFIGILDQTAFFNLLFGIKSMFFVAGSQQSYGSNNIENDDDNDDDQAKKDEELQQMSIAIIIKSMIKWWLIKKQQPFDKIQEQTVQTFSQIFKKQEFHENCFDQPQFQAIEQIFNYTMSIEQKSEEVFVKIIAKEKELKKILEKKGILQAEINSLKSEESTKLGSFLEKPFAAFEDKNRMELEEPVRQPQKQAQVQQKNTFVEQKPNSMDEKLVKTQVNSNELAHINNNQIAACEMINKNVQLSCNHSVCFNCFKVWALSKEKGNFLDGNDTYFIPNKACQTSKCTLQKDDVVRLYSSLE